MEGIPASDATSTCIFGRVLFILPYTLNSSGPTFQQSDTGLRSALPIAPRVLLLRQARLSAVPSNSRSFEIFLTGRQLKFVGCLHGLL